MAITLQFLGVNCDRITGLSFTLEAGAARVLRMASRDEKAVAIELAIGERAPDAGTVALNGVALDEAPPGSIGWVPENGGLVSNLKIWENVTLPLWYHGKRRVADTEGRLAHWLAALGLEGEAAERFMASPAGYLGKIELKSAGLLRGLLLAPRVLVVDAALFDGVTQETKAAWAAALDALARGDGSSILVAASNDAALPWANLEKTPT